MPTAERTAILEARLAILDEVLFKLASGESAVSVGADGEQVTFRATNRGMILDEINRIKVELGQTVTRRPRARGVVFA